MILPLVDVPFLEISIENPFSGRRYPERGTVLAVIDTGYEGFLMVPKDVFQALEFYKFDLHQRKLMLADGRYLTSYGTYGIVRVGDVKCEGFIEFSNVDELVLGIEFLSNFRITLDYCFKRLEILKC